MTGTDVERRRCIEELAESLWPGFACGFFAVRFFFTVQGLNVTFQ